MLSPSRTWVQPSVPGPISEEVEPIDNRTKSPRMNFLSNLVTIHDMEKQNDSQGQIAGKGEGYSSEGDGVKDIDMLSEDSGDVEILYSAPQPGEDINVVMGYRSNVDSGMSHSPSPVPQLNQMSPSPQHGNNKLNSNSNPEHDSVSLVMGDSNYPVPPSDIVVSNDNLGGQTARSDAITVSDLVSEPVPLTVEISMKVGVTESTIPLDSEERGNIQQQSEQEIISQVSSDDKNKQQNDLRPESVFSESNKSESQVTESQVTENTNGAIDIVVSANANDKLTNDLDSGTNVNEGQGSQKGSMTSSAQEESVSATDENVDNTTIQGVTTEEQEGQDKQSPEPTQGDVTQESEQYEAPVPQSIDIPDPQALDQVQTEQIDSKGKDLSIINIHPIK